MGARKSGRKKKAEWRKYKEHLQKLAKMEKAAATVRVVSDIALQIAHLKAFCSTERKFKVGGVCSGETSTSIEGVNPVIVEVNCDPLTDEQRDVLEKKMFESISERLGK